MTTECGREYLAMIPIGGGSSWGRAPDKQVAIENAVTALRDWSHLFKVAGIEVTVNVLDVTGYGSVSWSYSGAIGKNEQTGVDERIDRPFEHVTRTTPKWRRK